MEKTGIIELKVEGMTCGHCVATVKQALQAVPGVESARVSLEEGRAWVHGEPDPQALMDAVAEAGYRALLALPLQGQGDRP